MKIEIAILGSTGSIGKTLLNIIKRDQKKFKIKLLTANKNYTTLLNQAKKFNVKNLVVTDSESFKKLKKLNKRNRLNIYNSYENFNKIFKKKIHYVMSSIVGVEGLEPTIKIIKFTKKIAIANKESIICGWDLIKKELKKNKTKFIPVDSEHFSLWYGLSNLKIESVEKIYLTASGGPFFKTPLRNFKKITVNQAIKHPNWKMGKKISVDSSTMINKIYEVIEAKNIFNIPYRNIEILIHPKSYVHALIKFKNGLIKLIAHETTMKIPIFNTIYSENSKKIKTNKINLYTLNKLNFNIVNNKRFPVIKLLKLLPERNSLYETVIVSANDTLVELFLKKKIKYTDIQKKLIAIIKKPEFLKFKKIYPKNTKDIIKLNNYVRLNVLKNVYKS